MSTTVVLDVRFEAAHHLPHVPENHKCRRLHGHSYRAELHVSGPVDPQMGWVQDYADIREAFEPLHQALDHRYLNEVEGLENPTSENIARWIYDRLKPAVPGLDAVVLHESTTERCIYAPTDARVYPAANA